MPLTPGLSGVFADWHGTRAESSLANPGSPGGFFSERPVYPIVDVGVWGDRDPGPVLRALRAVGIRIVQLRGKGMPAGALLSWVSAGVQGAAGSGLRVVVNDRADVALLSRADGVHLGQDDLSPRAARALLGESAVIGLSTHTVEELRGGPDRTRGLRRHRTRVRNGDEVRYGSTRGALGSTGGAAPLPGSAGCDRRDRRPPGFRGDRRRSRRRGRDLGGIRRVCPGGGRRGA